MKINLTQSEVHEAIEDYVYKHLTNTGRIVEGSIDFTAGRKNGNGTTCDLEITSSPMLDPTYTEEVYKQPELPFTNTVKENTPEESDTVEALFSNA